MTRATDLALIGVLLALPALAESPLQGQWKHIRPTDPNHVGIILIDGEGRATYDSPTEDGRPAHFRGYVARADDTGAEIVLTDGKQVVKAYCVLQSSELMHCRNVRADESISKVYILARQTREVEKLWRGPR